MQGSELEFAFEDALEAVRKIIQKSKPQTSTCVYSCLVVLFVADSFSEDRFVYTNKVIMMQIDVDRALKSKFLRFYDLDSLHIVCELELYYGFAEAFAEQKIACDSSGHFYSFDYLEDTRFGVLFRNHQEAEGACMKIRSLSPKLSDLRQHQQAVAQKYLKAQKEKQFFSQIIQMSKKLMNMVLQRQFFEQEREQAEEGQVINVVRHGTVSFDPRNGVFKGQNLSPEVEQILNKVSKGAMSNKEKAKAIEHLRLNQQKKMD